MIFLHLAKHGVGIELFMVEDEHHGTGKPLAVELSPDSLAPSRVSHGEVDAVFLEVMPEDACGEVAQGIEVVVSHHLRFSAGAAGEVHQQGIFIAVDICGLDKGRCLVNLFMPGVPTA